MDHVETGALSMADVTKSFLNHLCAIQCQTEMAIHCTEEGDQEMVVKNWQLQGVLVLFMPMTTVMWSHLIQPYSGYFSATSMLNM